MQTFTVTITEISDETHDTRSFTTDRPEGFDFSPGQYCLFWLDSFSRPRPFTIASTPDEHYLNFTIKKIGEFTTAMFELKTGDSLKITSPRDSKLSIRKPPTNPIVLIAGGSGITPFYPIISSFSSRSDITLLYSNRTDNDIIFKEQLNQLAQENDSFHLQFFVTHQDNTQFTAKRIDKKDLKKVQKKDTQWYVCGPPGMTKAVWDSLLELGVSEECIYKEMWELPGKHHNE